MIILLVTLMFVFLLLRVPIFISIGLSSFIVLYFGTDINLTLSIQRFLGGLDRFVLMALPLFIYAAEIMVTGGLSKRILNWSKCLVGHITGGLGMTTQVSSMFFGSLCGSSPATVVAIGKIMYPEMIKEGYSRNFAAGLITSSGSVALLIPPSLTMIVYASVANVSVGEMFMAGVGSGILYGLAYILYIYYHSKKNKLVAEKRVSFSTLIKQTIKSFWALLMPVIILGGIYSGIFTPTEAAGVSVIYSILVAMFIYKELDLKGLYQASIRAVISSAQVLVLISSASLLGWLLTVLQVPQILADSLLNNIHSAWIFLLILNVILLIVGMFIDPTTAVIIIAPLILSTAVALDINLVHLGIIMIANLTIGMFTPPFGLNLYVAMGITKLRLGELMPGLTKFIIISILALLIISYIPEITMFIPEQLYGSK
ncbi:TRAP transporter large permease [Fredinandcohnia onubensis]|uniref:TRAP transporter large permease n=1 Tax=Fredinandcohnia onubensis TaxID=1571209 RepID=UPI000C0BFC97|nr:TRAP transporter large permease [Fredinandcohnia onubensis]